MNSHKTITTATALRNIAVTENQEIIDMSFY